MTEDILKSSVNGYGLVFKNVMKDQHLDIEAKALYAYLSAYAGSEGIAFPGVDLICHELKVSEKRYKKYRKQLEDAGYLTIKRNRKESGFSNNIYHINHQGLSGQNVTVTNRDEKAISGQIVPEQIVPGQNVSEQIVPGQNVGTKNNSITSNNITSNNITSNSRSSSKDESRDSVPTEKKKGTTTTADLENMNAFEYYEEASFGILNSPVTQDINYYIDQFGEEGQDIVKLGMEIAVFRGPAKTNWSYVKGILNNWLKTTYRTVDDIKAYEKQESEQRKNKAYSYASKQNQSNEKTPKWIEQMNNDNQSEQQAVSADDVDKQIDLKKKLSEFRGEEWTPEREAEEKRKLEEELKNFWKDEEGA